VLADVAGDPREVVAGLLHRRAVVRPPQTVGAQPVQRASDLRVRLRASALTSLGGQKELVAVSLHPRPETQLGIGIGPPRCPAGNCPPDFAALGFRSNVGRQLHVCADEPIRAGERLSAIAPPAEAARIGISTTSTPTGSPANPYSSSSVLIFPGLAGGPRTVDHGRFEPNNATTPPLGGAIRAASWPGARDAADEALGRASMVVMMSSMQPPIPVRRERASA
jgi:hypothetical protein